MDQQITNSLPAICEAIDKFGGGSEAIDNKQLYAEVFPAGLAIGLQPVRNIWGAATFERARREVVRLIEGSVQPEMSYLLKLRLDEHLIAWRDADPTTGGNMPWHDVTGGVLSHLGVARSMIGDTPVIDPIAIMVVSSMLLALPGMFWKNIEKQFMLS
jgi:hypothetical protein